MPMKRERYPLLWEEIAEKVKAQAGWCCEECGIGHKADGTHGSVLTVHHPDHDPENEHPRLQALCARCHLKAERRARRVRLHERQAVFQFGEEFHGAGDPV